MSNVIEIKAMSKEQAITRALKRMEATPDQIVKVVEKQKSRSFIFGLFEKEGIYEIEISKEIVKKEEEKVQHTQVEEKREVPKKREVKEHKENNHKEKTHTEHKKEQPVVAVVKLMR